MPWCSSDNDPSSILQFCGQPSTIVSPGTSSYQNSIPLSGVNVNTTLGGPGNPAQYVFNPSLQASFITPDISNVTYPVNLTSSPSSPCGTSESKFAHPGNLQSLTFMTESPQKRTANEVDSDSGDFKAAKQILSEKKLFEQFGSLNLDNEPALAEVSKNLRSSNPIPEHIKEVDLRMYVYLLNLENKGLNVKLDPVFQRLNQLEMEKRSKALIPWTPPLKDSLYTSITSASTSKVDTDDDTDDETADQGKDDMIMDSS